MKIFTIAIAAVEATVPKMKTTRQPQPLFIALLISLASIFLGFFIFAWRMTSFLKDGPLIVVFLLLKIGNPF
jgi:hypothetical protein